MVIVLDVEKLEGEKKRNRFFIGEGMFYTLFFGGCSVWLGVSFLGRPVFGCSNRLRSL